MAYISINEVKTIRENIKSMFPVASGWKFSVRRAHASAVYVSLVQYPAGYDFPDSYTQLNPYYPERWPLGDREREIMGKIHAIVSAKHWDKSDLMTDYHNCAFYYYIEIGRAYDRPAIVKQEKGNSKNGQ
jgi:hypothetical protein